MNIDNIHSEIDEIKKILKQEIHLAISYLPNFTFLQEYFHDMDSEEQLDVLNYLEIPIVNLTYSGKILNQIYIVGVKDYQLLAFIDNQVKKVDYQDLIYIEDYLKLLNFLSDQQE
jgi:hypothetical protein